MPITFACDKCGKKMQTGDEHAGRAVKCPQCGNRVTVPGAPFPEPAPPVAAAPSPPAPVRDQVRGRPLRGRGDDTFADRMRGISVFGIGPRGLTYIAIAIAIAVGVWIWSRPGEEIEIGDPQIVDSHVALRGVGHASGMQALGRAETDVEGQGSLSFGGSDCVVVIRPSEDAKYLLIPITLSQQHLVDNKEVTKNTFSIKARRFELVAGEPTLEPIMLMNSYEDCVRVDITGPPSSGDDAALLLLLRPSYDPLVERESGMRVETSEESDGRFLVVRWSEGCDAWRGTKVHSRTRKNWDWQTTDFFLLFERPKSGGKPIELRAFDKVVATYPPELGL